MIHYEDFYFYFRTGVGLVGDGVGVVRDAGGWVWEDVYRCMSARPSLLIPMTSSHLNFGSFDSENDMPFTDAL